MTALVGTAYAQRGATSKTVTTTKLANVQSTTEQVESYSLESGYEMMVTPLIASVKVLDDGKNPDGTKKFSHKTFRGAARLDGKTGTEYLVSKQTEGKRVYVDFDMLKSQVIYDFCRETGADLIVMPQFSARHKTHKVPMTDENGNSITVEEPVEQDGKYIMEVDMVGFPAVYVGFREGTEHDGWIKDLFREGRIGNEDTAIHVEEEIVAKK